MARRSDVQPLRIDITSGGEGFTFDDFIRDILNFLCFQKNLENAKHTSVPHWIGKCKAFSARCDLACKGWTSDFLMFSPEFPMVSTATGSLTFPRGGLIAEWHFGGSIARHCYTCVTSCRLIAWPSILGFPESSVKETWLFVGCGGW
jgi:hypothetical protein